MGTLTSGVGLISGLNIQDLVQQLMQLQARPLHQLQQRIGLSQQRMTAYAELSARLLAAQGPVGRLANPSAFTARTAASSNTSILTATATESTPLDTYQFQVKSLVSTHQLISAQGFASRTATLGAGSLTLEIGKGRLDPATALSGLNGSEGIRRGVIRITDRSGASADIDLRTAVRLDEVLEAINNQTGIRVGASIRGDRLVITDMSGGTAGPLSVVDVSGGYAAQDLGIATSSADGQIVGSDIIWLADRTRLARLNDGNGVRVHGTGDDIRFTLKDGREIDVNLSGMLRFSTRLAELNDGQGVNLGTIRITNREGASAEIDLAAAETLQDVANAINSSGLSVAVSLSGSRLAISDSSGGTVSNLIIEDVEGTAAADLGVRANTASSGVSGASIYRMDTLGAVLRAIQYADNNAGALVASIPSGGNGIILTDTTAGGGASTVAALNDSLAWQDLGLAGGFDGQGVLESRDLIAGLNTVLLASLNGGSGVDTSDLRLVRRIGETDFTEAIDVTGAQTLQAVIEAINSHRDGNDEQVFQAEVSRGGTGIVIRDISGGVLVGVEGQTAVDLRLDAGAQGNSVLNSGNLQLRYISENTTLADLNQGRGIAYGSFRITVSDGRSAVLTLNAGTHKTVGDVLKAINNLNMDVTARINGDGDGIELVDAAGGAGVLTVADEGAGTTAADLRIAGSADDGNILTGSFAGSIQISGSDTLDDVVARINGSGLGVRASLINDGTGDNPYRLVISSSTAGLGGRINFSTEGWDVDFNTLSRGRDATVVIGSLDSGAAVVVTSGSNTLRDVIEGLTLELHGTGSAPVEVTVALDIDQVVADVKALVSGVNEAFKRIDELTRFDAETNQRGILLGEPAVLRIRERLYARLSASLNDAGLSLTSLRQVGLTLGQGARLQLDEDRLRTALADDIDAVRQLFTLTATDDEGKPINKGLVARLNQELKGLTDSADGFIKRQQNTIQSRVDVYNQRATQMQKLLDQREVRLYAQFQGMERALSRLQTQQAALASLAQATNFFTGGGGVLG